MEPQFVKIQVSAYGMPPSDEKRALELIETCGRTAYKSEDKISDDSAKSFVLMLKKHGHLSVLEHSNIVFQVEPREKTDDAVRDVAAALVKTCKRETSTTESTPMPSTLRNKLDSPSPAITATPTNRMSPSPDRRDRPFST